MKLLKLFKLIKFIWLELEIINSILIELELIIIDLLIKKIELTIILDKYNSNLEFEFIKNNKL